MNDQPWTIQRLLDWTTNFFLEKQADSPRLDAEVLLSHCLACQRIDLYTRFAEIVPDEVRTRFRGWVKRRAAGEPVAYLVGHREFYSLDFIVSPAVLIPRPETEHLVIETLDRLGAKPRTTSKAAAPLPICDVGTGSGVIAICLAKYLPQAEITAVDLSEEALKIARQNAERHRMDQRITFLKSDLLAGIAETTKFQAIVSNPPYVSSVELESVPDSVKKFEPHLALVGAGKDGGQTSRNLIDQAGPRLQPGGWLLLETSPMLSDNLKYHFQQSGQWSEYGIAKDSAGLPRVVWGKKF